MYACSYDSLNFNLPLQSHDEMHRERIATLKRQIEVLQIDKDDDDEGGSGDGARGGDDPEGTEPDARDRLGLTSDRS